MEKKPPAHFHLGSFAKERGDHSAPGSKDVYGVLPQVVGVPYGPSPAYLRQVLSTFDSRPIGGYDFVQDDEVDPYTVNPGGSIFTLSFTTPFGYVSVVRRIELEADGGYLTPIGGTAMSALAQIGNISVPNWRWPLGAAFTERAIDCFFIVPRETTFAVRVDLGSLSSVFGSSFIRARFIGNLILDTNEPPTEQIGARPHRVIDYVPTGDVNEKRGGL